MNVARLDNLDNTGWMEQLRLDYVAWLPTKSAETDLYRSGDVHVRNTFPEDHAAMLPHMTVLFRPGQVGHPKHKAKEKAVRTRSVSRPDCEHFARPIVALACAVVR